METAAYYAALLSLLASPYIFVYWFLLHPFASRWRRLGPTVTSLIVHSIVLLVAGLLFLFREPLLRVRFGVRGPLVALAALFFLASVSISVPRSRQMSSRTLLGIPEVSSDDPGQLITGGIYSRIRNPRYVEACFWLGALALFSNYLAAYVVWAAYVPAILLVVLLEERELRSRFGRSYEEYCGRVPRFVPRFGKRAPGRQGG